MYRDQEDIIEKLQKSDRVLAERLSYCLRTSEDNIDNRIKLDVLRNIDTLHLLSGGFPSFDLVALVSSLAHSTFDLLRNIFVLFPVAFTWFSLSEALKAYVAVAELYPNTPFLVLWEKSFFDYPFNEHLAFSTVAYYDALLILFIVVLTFFSFASEKLEYSRVERVFRNLKLDVDALIWEQERELHTKVSQISLDGKNIESILEKFDILINRIYAENKDMQSQFEKIATDIHERDKNNTISLNAERVRAKEIGDTQIRIAEDLDKLSKTLQEIAYQEVDFLRKSQDAILDDSNKYSLEDIVRELAQQKAHLHKISENLKNIRDFDSGLLQKQVVFWEKTESIFAKLDLLVENIVQQEQALSTQGRVLAPRPQSEDFVLKVKYLLDGKSFYIVLFMVVVIGIFYFIAKLMSMG